MVILLQLCLFALAAFTRGRFLFGTHLATNKDDHTKLEYEARSKGTVTNRHIGITQDYGLPFIVRPERWYHRVFKAIGLASEVQIRREEFDNKYFIITDMPGHLERAVSSGSLTTELQKLFQLPIKSLHATHTKLWVRLKREDFKQPAEYFDQHRAILKSISAHTKYRVDHSSVNQPKRNAGYWAFLFLCAHAGLLTWGIFGGLPTLADNIEMLDRTEWFAQTIVLGLVLATIWFMLIVAFFRSTSWVCWVMVDFMLCGILGIMLTSHFIAREANVHLPQPAPTVYRQPISEKYCVLECRQRCGKRCTRRSNYSGNTDAHCSAQSRPNVRQRYMQIDSICRSSANFAFKITIRHWEPQKQYYRFPTNASFFDSVSVGQYVDVPVNEGAYGIKWINQDEIR